MDKYPRITVDQYHRMIEAGVFDTEEKERCELIEGWIVPKARQSPGHCYVREILAGWQARWKLEISFLHFIEVGENLR